MKVSRLITVCVCFLLYALLRYPQEMLQASAKGFSLWFSTVLPSLFPFLAATGILLRMGVAEILGRFLQPLMSPLFGVSGICAFPFVSGLLSGYPAGAKATAMLYETHQLSLSEAQKVLRFCNNPGPLFIIGTVGTGFLGNAGFGYALLLATSCGAILTGICFRSVPSAPILSNIRSQPKKEPFFPLFSNAVTDALFTCAQIGGCLVFFCVCSEALLQSGFLSLLARGFHWLPVSEAFLQAAVSGCLEMTNGAFQFSTAPDNLRLRLSATAALLSFGGLSILGQTCSVLQSVPIRFRAYLGAKCCNAGFSALLMYGLFPFFETCTQKAVPVFSAHTATAFPLLFSVFAFCLLWITLRMLVKH